MGQKGIAVASRRPVQYKKQGEVGVVEIIYIYTKITVPRSWKRHLQNNNQGGICCSLSIGASRYYELKLFLIKSRSVSQSIVQGRVKTFESASTATFPEDH